MYVKKKEDIEKLESYNLEEDWAYDEVISEIIRLLKGRIINCDYWRILFIVYVNIAIFDNNFKFFRGEFNLSKIFYPSFDNIFIIYNKRKIIKRRELWL